MYALTGCTGKIGGATLEAILKYTSVQPKDLVICTSSDPTAASWDKLKSQGAQVRLFKHEEPSTMTSAFAGCTKLFLVSTPKISMDFFDAPYGQGREAAHFASIDAAKKAGVQHIYYTSLAFGDDSVAGVMQAHLRTEAYLKSLDGVKYTIIREGLYNESWPLYLGHYDVEGDERKEVVIAGDGPISWTSIRDLGITNALVIADLTNKYEGKTFYLSATGSTTLKEISAIVSRVRGSEVVAKVVSTEDYSQHYVKDKGMGEGNIGWWSSTYPALERNECLIGDTTFSELLEQVGVRPITVEETIKGMLAEK